MNTTTTEIEFTLSIEPDLSDPADQLISGEREYEEMERQDIQDIYRRQEYGDYWGWCVVKVTAEFRGYKGYDYLGGCNYDSEEQFKEPGGYYDDMKAQACIELVGNIENKLATLQAQFYKTPTRNTLLKLSQCQEDYLDLIEQLKGGLA